MFWAPYRASELKTINSWFNQPNSAKKKVEKSLTNSVRSIGTFFKSLFFDRTIVKQIQAHHFSKHKLSMYLQEGKISLNEYLFLNR